MIRVDGDHMYYCKKSTDNSIREKNAEISSFDQRAVDFLNLCRNACNKGGVLYGRVINKFGQPVKCATVKIVSETHEPILLAKTDGLGIYFIFDVPADRPFLVIAAAENYRLNDGMRICIKEREVLKMDIVLSYSGSDDTGVVTGIVLNKLNSLPIGRAQVVLYRENRGVPSFENVTHTNEYGKFALTRLAQGTYLVKLYACGYSGGQYRVVITKCRPIVNLVLPLCPGSRERNGTVSGVVTDLYQMPIADADVILYKVKSSSEVVPVAYTNTNNNGVYLFVNVGIGSYQVSAK